MVAKRGGRRAKPLKPAKELVTRRVRHLVDLAHEGNVHEASKVSGVPSATLRALYTGRNTNPSLSTLQQLGQAYGFHAGWFTDPKAPEAVPIGGLQFTVRVPNPRGGMKVVREITIPWASWPLPDVYRKLGDYLLSLPRDADRPIIGDLAEGSESITEMSAKVALFLLAPLDRALELEGVELHRFYDFTGPGGVNEEVAVRRMRLLGLFWEDALQDTLRRSVSAPHISM